MNFAQIGSSVFRYDTSVSELRRTLVDCPRVWFSRDTLATFETIPTLGEKDEYHYERLGDSPVFCFSRQFIENDYFLIEHIDDLGWGYDEIFVKGKVEIVEPNFPWLTYELALGESEPIEAPEFRQTLAYRQMSLTPLPEFGLRVSMGFSTEAELLAWAINR